MNKENMENIPETPEYISERYGEMINDEIAKKERVLGRQLNTEEISAFLSERERRIRERAWEQIRHAEEKSPLTPFEKLKIIREEDDESIYWDTLRDIKDTKASGFFVAEFSNIERCGIFEIIDGEMNEEDAINFQAYAGYDSGILFQTRDEAEKYADERDKKQDDFYSNTNMCDDNNE